MFFHQRFEKQVINTPNNIAIKFIGQLDISYASLNSRANQLARYLSQLGVIPEKETLVGIYLEPSPVIPSAILAIMKCGGAYVPLDPGLPQGRLSDYLVKSRPPFVIVENRHLKIELEQLLLKSNCQYTQIICLEEIQSILNTQPPTNLDLNLSANQLAYLMFTSGSTGEPKGVLIEHKGLIYPIEAHIKTLKLTAQDKVAQFASIAFDASLMEIMMTLCCGACLFPIPANRRLDPNALANYYQLYGISVAIFTPSMLAILNPQYFENMRVLISTGEPIDQDKVINWTAKGREATQPRLIVNGYGPSEASICTTLGICSQSSGVHIGNAITGLEVFILEMTVDGEPEKADSEKKPVSADKTGELYIAGPGLARGYYKNERLTDERFVIIAHPITQQKIRAFKSNDMVSLSKEENLLYHGRLDDQVKICGQLAHPEELRKKLAENYLVQNVVINIKDKETYCPKFIAYIEFKEKNKINQVEQLTSLHHFLSHQLPRYMLPSEWVIVDDIPLNSSKKPNKTLLLERTKHIEPRRILTISPVMPRDDIEKDIADVWQSIFNLNFTLDIHANFKLLGGYSIQYLQIINKLCESPKYQKLKFPSLGAFYINPTIGMLGRFLRKQINKSTQNTKIMLKRLIDLKDDFPSKESVNKIPYFIVPAITCDPKLEYKELIENWDWSRALYSFEFNGLENALDISDNIEEIASDLIELIKKKQKTGPYFIGGWSTGGIIAAEIAHQLQQRFDKVSVFIIDSIAPRYIQQLTPEQYCDQSLGLINRLYDIYSVKNSGHDVTTLKSKIPEVQLNILFDKFEDDFRIVKNIRFSKENKLLVNKVRCIRGLAQAELRYTASYSLSDCHLFVANKNIFPIPVSQDLGWGVRSENICAFPHDHFSIIASRDFIALLQSKINSEEEKYARLPSTSLYFTCKWPSLFKRQKIFLNPYPARNAKYVTSEEGLEKKLNSPNIIPVQNGNQFYNRMIISGLPGVGKSAFVREFIYRRQDDFDVFAWFDARSDLTEQFKRLLKTVLNIDRPLSNDVMEIVELTYRKLNKRKLKFVFVFDDADNFSFVKNFLPRFNQKDEQAHKDNLIILITHRHVMNSCRLEGLTADEIKSLISGCNASDITKFISLFQSAFVGNAALIIQTLKIINTVDNEYIKNEILKNPMMVEKLSFHDMDSDYFNESQTKPNNTTITNEGQVYDSAMSYPKSVYDGIVEIIEKHKSDKILYETICICVFFYHRHISKILLAPDLSDATYIEMLIKLQNMFLINIERNALSLHDTVCLALNKYISSNADLAKSMFNLATRRLKAAFDYRYILFPFQANKHPELIVHINFFIAHYHNGQHLSWYTQETYDLYLSLADFYLFERENYIKGEEVLKKIDKNKLSSEQLIYYYQNYTYCTLLQNDTSPILVNILKGIESIQKAQLSDDDKKIHYAILFLIFSYVLNSDHQRSEYLNLLRRVLPILLKRHEDPALLTVLANAYFENANITQARDLYEHIKPLIMHRFGSQNPMVISYQITYARIQLKLGNISEGKQIFQSIIEKTEMLHGNCETHQISSIYRNYADGLLENCREFKQAIFYYEKALKIREKLYGSASHANLKNLYLGLKAAYQQLSMIEMTKKYQILLDNIEIDSTNKKDKEQLNATLKQIISIADKYDLIEADNNISSTFRR